MLVDYGTFPLKKWGRKGNDNNMIVLTLKKKKNQRLLDANYLCRIL